MQNAQIDTYMGKLNLKRYEGSFKTLFKVLLHLRKDPLMATLHDIAQGILFLGEFSLSEARNGYSAMLLILGFENLRFETLLTPSKSHGTSMCPNIPRFGTLVPY